MVEKGETSLQLGLLITGTAVLIPLLVITIGVLFRKVVRKSIKSILFVCTTLLLSTVMAIGLIYFALSDEYMAISRGDQVILKGVKQELRYHFCQGLQLTSDVGQIRVWPVHLALNERPRALFKLTLAKDENVIFLNLQEADEIGFENFSNGSKFTLKNEREFKGSLSHSDILIDQQEKAVKVEESNRYRIEVLGEMRKNEQGLIKVTKKRLAPTKCEIVTCESLVYGCDSMKSYKRLVIDYQLQDEEILSYTSTKIRIQCKIKWWLLAITFGCGPLLFIFIFVIITVKVCREEELIDEHTDFLARSNLGYVSSQNLLLNNGYI
ncbi:hypothetical protein Ciccas_002288 [Cichlidogyrus casuarinus]|uniref:DUF5730 domain-containing protein n=1 Tax=Cichlidogyrus casuarinus TaxID=1844966 RepID=A0ABD2QHK1_9PLAT